MTLFKSARMASLAFLFAAATLAWSQSTPGPRELLGLGTHHSTIPVKRNAVSGAITPAAKVYKFASADFPGAAASLVFDRNTSTVLGDSSFTTGFAFTLAGVNYATVKVPGSADSEATGINTTGAIVGIYVDLSSVTHGFLKKGATLTTMDLAGGSLEPFDINDSGEIVCQGVTKSGELHACRKG